MPDAYGNLTDNEKMLLRAQQLRAMTEGQTAPQMSPTPSGMTPGMSPVGAGNITAADMAAAVRDTAPQRADMNSQMEFAQDLMQSEAPKGVQAGNVYVGPTWAAGLANAVRQGTGGYMAYKTGQKRGELNAEQTAIDEAAGRVAAGQYIDERGDKGAEQAAAIRQLGQGDRGLDLESARDAADAKHNAAVLAEQIRQTKIAEGVAATAATSDAGDLARAWAGTEGETWLNTGTGEAASTWLTPTGRVMAGPNGTVVPVDGRTWKPQGKVVATKQEDLLAADTAMADLDPTAKGNNMMAVLRSPVLEEATGVGPQRFLGQVGLGPQGPEVQATQMQIERNSVGGFLDDLQGAGLAPVSDKEGATLMRQYAQLATQPLGQVEFAANYYRPKFVQQFNQAVKQGVVTPEYKEQYMRNMDMAIADAAVKYGYPVSQLATQGLDPLVLERALLQEKKKRGAQ